MATTAKTELTPSAKQWINVSILYTVATGFLSDDGIQVARDRMAEEVPANLIELFHLSEEEAKQKLEVLYNAIVPAGFVGDAVDEVDLLKELEIQATELEDLDDDDYDVLVMTKFQDLAKRYNPDKVSGNASDRQKTMEKFCRVIFAKEALLFTTDIEASDDDIKTEAKAKPEAKANQKAKAKPEAKTEAKVIKRITPKAMPVSEGDALDEVEDERVFVAACMYTLNTINILIEWKKGADCFSYLPSMIRRAAWIRRDITAEAGSREEKLSKYVHLNEHPSLQEKENFKETFERKTKGKKRKAKDSPSPSPPPAKRWGKTMLDTGAPLDNFVVFHGISRPILKGVRIVEGYEEAPTAQDDGEEFVMYGPVDAASQTKMYQVFKNAKLLGKWFPLQKMCAIQDHVVKAAIALSIDHLKIDEPSGTYFHFPKEWTWIHEDEKTANKPPKEINFEVENNYHELFDIMRNARDGNEVVFTDDEITALSYRRKFYIKELCESSTDQKREETTQKYTEYLAQIRLDARVQAELEKRKNKDVETGAMSKKELKREKNGPDARAIQL